MSDPFERAKAIRRGELDDEMPDYEELTGWMQRVPMTWLPGILAQVVTCCVAHRVFKDGGLMRFVDKARVVAADINAASLRDGDE